MQHASRAGPFAGRISRCRLLQQSGRDVEEVNRSAIGACGRRVQNLRKITAEDDWPGCRSAGRPKIRRRHAIPIEGFRCEAVPSLAQRVSGRRGIWLGADCKQRQQGEPGVDAAIISARPLQHKPGRALDKGHDLFSRSGNAYLRQRRADIVQRPAGGPLDHSAQADQLRAGHR